MFSLILLGYAPVICHADAERVFCNNASGYDVYAVAPDGSTRTLDSGNGPVDKAAPYTLVNGEQVIVIAR